MLAVDSELSHAGRGEVGGVGCAGEEAAITRFQACQGTLRPCHALFVMRGVLLRAFGFP